MVTPKYLAFNSAEQWEWKCLGRKNVHYYLFTRLATDSGLPAHCTSCTSVPALNNRRTFSCAGWAHLITTTILLPVVIDSLLLMFSVLLIFFNSGKCRFGLTTLTEDVNYRSLNTKPLRLYEQIMLQGSPEAGPRSGILTECLVVWGHSSYSASWLSHRRKWPVAGEPGTNTRERKNYNSFSTLFFQFSL